MKIISDSYLFKLWRQAVLKLWGNRCAFCGNPIIEDIECHHIVRRRHKVLRWDYRNGIPLCSKKVNPKYKLTCHQYGHTKLGESLIKEKNKHYNDIIILEPKNYRDYLLQNAVNDNEFREFKFLELKTIIQSERLTEEKF